MEYVIIDGGSTDGTVEIIRKHQDSLAYWHSQPDHGLAHAFNMGVEHSRGRWIAFLNADDCYSHDHVLSMIAEVLRQDGKDDDVVFGQIVFIDRCKDIRRLPTPPFGGPWSWRVFRRRSTIPHPAAFTQRRFIERVGGFDECFRNAADYELYLRAGAKLQARFVPEVLAYMRVGGMSRQGALRSLNESRLAQVKNSTQGRFAARLLWLNYAVRTMVKRGMLG